MAPLRRRCASEEKRGHFFFSSILLVGWMGESDALTNALNPDGNTARVFGTGQRKESTMHTKTCRNVKI